MGLLIIDKNLANTVEVFGFKALLIKFPLLSLLKICQISLNADAEALLLETIYQ